MNRNQSKIILVTTLAGALLGLGIGVVLAESKKEKLALAERYGDDKVVVQTGFKDWIAVSVAAITLLRNLADMLTPKT